MAIVDFATYCDDGVSSQRFDILNNGGDSDSIASNEGSGVLEALVAVNHVTEIQADVWVTGKFGSTIQGQDNCISGSGNHI